MGKSVEMEGLFIPKRYLETFYISHSVTQLIETVESLDKQGMGFKSLTENIDTTSPSGKLIFHIFAALEEFERSIIRKRTTAGLASARARGWLGGEGGWVGGQNH